MVRNVISLLSRFNLVYMNSSTHFVLPQIIESPRNHMLINYERE